VNTIFMTFHEPSGIKRRELIQKEIEDFAAMGDQECRRVLKKDLFDKAGNLQEKIDVIAEYLGLEDELPG
jgi:hypothetical protein